MVPVGHLVPHPLAGLPLLHVGDDAGRQAGRHRDAPLQQPHMSRSGQHRIRDIVVKLIEFSNFDIDIDINSICLKKVLICAFYIYKQFTSTLTLKNF